MFCCYVFDTRLIYRVILCLVVKFSNFDTRLIFVVVSFQILIYMYALLTKREVKMAGYWPRSFLRFYGPRRSRGP